MMLFSGMVKAAKSKYMCDLDDANGMLALSAQ